MTQARFESEFGLLLLAIPSGFEHEAGLPLRHKTESQLVVPPTRLETKTRPPSKQLADFLD
jgi:hypothetical protein